MPHYGICNPKTRYWVVRCICRRRLVVQRRWKTYVVCTLGCYRGSCATMAKAWRSKHAQKCCKRVRALSRSNLKWNRIARARSGVEQWAQSQRRVCSVARRGRVRGGWNSNSRKSQYLPDLALFQVCGGGRRAALVIEWQEVQRECSTPLRSSPE